MTEPELQPAARRTYIARINRVVDHISANLAGTLDLQALADVAYFSPWHFHRVFQAVTGETLADCVRRLRLEAAAQRLIFTPQTALQIALDTGFASAEVFSRAFRTHFDMTPTAWRRGGWRGWATRRQIELSKIHQGNHKPNQDSIMALFKDRSLWPTGPVPSSERTLAMEIELKTLSPHAPGLYAQHRALRRPGGAAVAALCRLVRPARLYEPAPQDRTASARTTPRSHRRINAATTPASRWMRPSSRKAR